MIMLLKVFTSLFLFCEIGLTVIEATMESPFKAKFELKRSIDKSEGFKSEKCWRDGDCYSL